MTRSLGMKHLLTPLRHSRGIATVEFLVAGFLFFVLLSSMLLLGEVGYAKIRSLVAARNGGFDPSYRTDGDMLLSRHVLLLHETSPVLIDKCLSPYLGSRISRVRAQVRLEVSPHFGDLLPIPGISDNYLLAQDSWKHLPADELIALISVCRD